MKIGCALLAAGASARFGSNKLLYPLAGSTLIERACALHAALPYAFRLLVTRRSYAAVTACGEVHGFTVLYNDLPERGMGSSVAIAATALLKEDVAGALFGVSDQPYLKRASIERMMEAFAREPEAIVAAAHGGMRGNPCLFPRSLFPALCALSGEQGGSAVIEQYSTRLLLIETAEAKELSDLDLPPEDES